MADRLTDTKLNADATAHGASGRPKIAPEAEATGEFPYTEIRWGN